MTIVEAPALSSPSSNLERRRRRVYAKHVPNWQRFQTALIAPSHQVAAIHKQSGGSNKKTLEIHPYQRQYSHVYHQRLEQLRSRCEDTWGNLKKSLSTPVERVERVLELQEDVDSFVIGTLVKDPSCVKGEEPLVEGVECRPSDTLALEDASGRVTLDFSSCPGDFNVHSYCTGMVVGVHGCVGTDGSLHVKTMVPPAWAPLKQCGPPASDHGDDPHVLLLSGLHFGSTSSSALPRDLLLTFLEGHLTHPTAPKIARIILAGGLLALEGETKTTATLATKSTPGLSPERTHALRDLDAFLFQLIVGAGIPVDVIPGAHDPTTANWPQRPLHGSLIPQTHRFAGTTSSAKLLARTTNPYACFHDGRYLLATDGTNVSSLKQHLLRRVAADASTSEDDQESLPKLRSLSELEAMECQISMGHVCPTGPAHVPTVPHPSTDPMVMQNMPHVYMAGNCTRFATTVLANNLQEKDAKSEKIRLICIPTFAKTRQAVVLNLRTLDVQVVQFEDTC